MCLSTNRRRRVTTGTIPSVSARIQHCARSGSLDNAMSVGAMLRSRGNPNVETSRPSCQQFKATFVRLTKTIFNFFSSQHARPILTFAFGRCHDGGRDFLFHPPYDSSAGRLVKVQLLTKGCERASRRTGKRRAPLASYQGKSTKYVPSAQAELEPMKLFQ